MICMEAKHVQLLLSASPKPVLIVLELDKLIAVRYACFYLYEIKYELSIN